MIRMAIISSAAALALIQPAGAQQYGYSSGYGYDDYGYQSQTYARSNCDRERRSNQTGGAIVGAIAGGLLGAAIADDGDKDRYHRRHRGYYRGWDRGYYGYRGHRRHKDNDGDKVAGALVGALVGGVAGSALAGSATDCAPRQAYGPSNPTQRYGNMNVSPPTRQAYGSGWNDNQPVRVGTVYQDGYSPYGYNQNAYADVRPGEELYGGPAYTDPSYGATTQGFNSGYNSGLPQDTGECRTVYRDRYVGGERVSEPATACNVGGDRWEFVE